MDSDTAVGSFDVIMPCHLRRASLIQLCNCGMITPPASRKKARGPDPAGSRKYRSLSVCKLGPANDCRENHTRVSGREQQMLLGNNTYQEQCPRPERRVRWPRRRAAKQIP